MTTPVSRISGGAAPSSPRGDYTIQRNDTLSKLAQRFGVSVQQLLDANPQITNKDVIRAGDRLVVPRTQAQRTEQPTQPQQTQQGWRPQGTTTTRPTPGTQPAPTGAEPSRPSPQTQAPQTQAPETQAPQTQAADELRGVRDGTQLLSRGAQGPSVTKAQELLVKNGYPLAPFGADGDFGGVTETAVKTFQRQNGLPENGKIDQATLGKLEAGAAQNVKYPEYDKLFADGVMRTTIAIGYDEGGWQKPEIKKVVDGLAAQGYESVDVSTMSDADIRSKLGVDPATVDRESTYFVKSFQHDGKDVKAVTRLITPDTPNAKQKFAEATAHDEVVLYGGHGRYGSGPDFDDKHSAAGNFRIGDPYEAGKVTLGGNDLQRTSMTKDYQLMFFRGCTTNLYLDDLRGKARGKNAENLDVIATNTVLYWDDTANDILAVTGGLTSGKSIDELKSQLNANNVFNKPDEMRDKFTFDGFQNNAVQSHR
jgi:LysM repeat protein